MKWSFTHNGQPQTAEWRKNAMRCTMPEVIERVDTIIAEGGLVPCGSATHMVVPTLATEAGGYAAITLAIQEFADFMSLVPPRSEATVVGDVVIDATTQKAAQQHFGSRSEAGRYAARIRWGVRSGDMVQGGITVTADMTDEEFLAYVSQEVTSIRDLMSQMEGCGDEAIGVGQAGKDFDSLDEIDNSATLWVNKTTNEVEPSPLLAEVHDRTLALGWEVRSRAMSQVERDFPEAADGQKELRVMEAERRMMEQVRGVGETVNIVSSKGLPDPRLEQTREISRLMPTEWIADINAMSALPNEQGQSHGPMSLNLVGWEGNGGGAFGYTRTAGASMTLMVGDFDYMGAIIGHEMTHAAEHARPKLAALGFAFLAFRARTKSDGSTRSGDKLSELRTEPKRPAKIEMFGGHVAADDGHFTVPYAGRRYIDRDTGRRSLQSSEVLTTAMDKFWTSKGGTSDYVPEKDCDAEHNAFGIGALMVG